MQISVRDDGLGNLKTAAGDTVGTINYSTGVAHIDPDTTLRVPVARYAVKLLGYNSGGPVYRNVFSGFEYLETLGSLPASGGTVSAAFRSDNASTSVNTQVTQLAVGLDLTDGYSEPIVPGSVNFSLGGKTYFDRQGMLYYDLDVTTGAATQAGAINYSTGDVLLSAWVPGASSAVTLRSLLTTLDGTPVDEVTFRVPVAPIRPSSLQILATRLSGGTLNVTASSTGEISGTGIVGTVNYETGVVRVRFGAFVTAVGNESEIWYDAAAVGTDGKIFKPSPVFADTIRYNAVAYSYLPLDSSIIGLDPVRLPQDGRVPIFRTGGFVVIGHTGSIGPAMVSNGQTINCGRVRLSRVRVIGHDGDVIAAGYTADLEAGSVSFTDVSGYSQPVTIEHRIEDMAQVSDVQISGRLAFTRQVTHNYPAGSVVSSALVAGDLAARVEKVFDQATWSSSWSDSVSGGVATGTYNTVLAPIEVTNAGATGERWAIVFTNTTTFNVMGEHVGVIATGNLATDLAPINPATGEPYFTLRATGWGSGWAAGNVLRFNTVGALFPSWVVRTVQQGQETVTDDSFTLLVRGDVDNPL